IRRRPPLDSLFPYTTLFRSHRTLYRSLPGCGRILLFLPTEVQPSECKLRISRIIRTCRARSISLSHGVLRPRLSVNVILRPGRRSEEHTSELQSRENLVCRL